MTLKATKPAPRVNGTGLGHIECFPAIDTRVSSTPSDLRATWIARRCRIDPLRASIVAELAFGRPA